MKNDIKANDDETHILQNKAEFLLKNPLLKAFAKIDERQIMQHKADWERDIENINDQMENKVLESITSIIDKYEN